MISRRIMAGALQVFDGIHLAVEHSDHVYRGRGRGVVDRMAIDEQDSVSLAHETPCRAELWAIRKPRDAVVELVEILICLGRAPLFEGVLPDADEVAFGEGVFADRSRQDADLARRRALRLMSFMSNSPVSPLFSPSISA